MVTTREEQANSPGMWPADFPLRSDGTVAEGLVVLSQSGSIEGRTTGHRSRCLAFDCPGWFIGVNWETGQPALRPCSEGWHYDPTNHTVRITGGGEISARFGAPAPLGIAPATPDSWPDRTALKRRSGWRVGNLDDHHLRVISQDHALALDAHRVESVVSALEEIGTLGQSRRWTSGSSSVMVDAVPPWLAAWIEARTPGQQRFRTVQFRWHPYAPESWRLGMRAGTSSAVKQAEAVYRDDGWVHPEIPPGLWPELTRRIWGRETVTDVVHDLGWTDR